MEIKKVCTHCRFDIDAGAVTVVRPNGMTSYFHEYCLPVRDQWRLRVQKKKDEGPKPI